MSAEIDDLLPRAPASSQVPEQAGPAEATTPAPLSSESPPVPLTVTVVWGDLTKTPADVHLTGHYYGVMPSAAERALDLAISPPGSRGLIADHTRRRWLTGMLGQLTYFPAPPPDG